MPTRLVPPRKRRVARTTEGIDPERSARMRLIKGRDTKPEWIVRRALHAAGLRYRLHAQDLPGRPDIVFRKQRVAIMVHGCFWHQHPDPACRLARMPKSRQEFWRPKLMGNRARDEAVRARLQADGWRVFELWECQLNTEFLARFTSELRALL
jgi:DNA mismatch endonuclease (patch repair protein)